MTLPLPLTLFAIPRAFQRHIGIAQRNAIRSWKALRPTPRIILLGDDPGTAEAAREFGCDHIPEVATNEFGTPLLKSIFAQAHAAAGGGTMIFVNSDIILTGDLSDAMALLPQDNFLMMGVRTHLIVRDELDVGLAQDDAALRRRVAIKGQRGGPTAIDYFVFPHGLFADVPNFAIGRGWWDHWLITDAQRRGVQLIDASQTVLAVHQDHGFLATEESVRNLALYGQPTDNASLDMARDEIADGALRPKTPPKAPAVTVLARSRSMLAKALRRAAARLQPQ